MIKAHVIGYNNSNGGTHMSFFSNCAVTCLQAWDAAGNWASAIGTVAAVFAAIWIAQRDNAIRLRVSAVVGQIIGDPEIPDDQDAMIISALNAEIRPSNLRRRRATTHRPFTHPFRCGPVLLASQGKSHGHANGCTQRCWDRQALPDYVA